MKPTGQVVLFDDAKGFGFIREKGAPSGHIGTIFFHHSDVLLEAERRYVGPEQVLNKQVEFDLEIANDGRHRARKVRVL